MPARKLKARTRTYQRKADDPAAITPTEYGGLQAAYDHFDAALFDGELPDVFITYQRKANSMGYFAADRFAFRAGKSGKHELALNPDAFINQTDEQICQTLVHEMVHVWQHAYGKPGARGYHNKQWAAKMKAIGLQPSSTGMVGGKETGQRMMDYIIPGGAFTQVFTALAGGGWKLNLQSAHRAGGKKAPNSKTKFSCSSCDQNAWGKPDLAITCKLCDADMVAERVSVDAVPTPSYDQQPASVEVEVLPSYEPSPEAEPVKRKGSKNKPKKNVRSYDEKRTRKNKPITPDEAVKERAA